MTFGSDDHLTHLVERIHRGDAEARDQLLSQSFCQFQTLARNIAAAHSAPWSQLLYSVLAGL